MLDTMAEVCGLVPSVSMKRAVDLDLLDREAGEIGEARIAGAEIVHGDRYAELVEAGERVQHRVGVLQDDAFGDLELEPVRLKPGLGQHPAHQPINILGLELRRREVDGSVAGADWLANAWVQHVEALVEKLRRVRSELAESSC